jgi:hypothetical protein
MEMDEKYEHMKVINVREKTDLQLTEWHRK